jgi:pentatricopeptide repeat protein
MKKAWIIIILLINLINVTLADNLPDSSKSILNSLNDDNKVLLLQRWAWDLRYSQQIIALKYLKESIILSNKLNNFEAEATGYNYMGVIFISQNDYYNALKQYNQALEISEKHNILKQLAYCKNNLGQLRLLKGDYTEAIRLMKESAEQHRKNSDRLGMAYSFIRLCDAFLMLKQYDSAYFYANNAYLIRKESGNKSGVEKAQMSMAEALVGLGRTNEALAEYLSLDPLNQDKSVLYVQISKAYKELENTDKEIFYLKLAKQNSHNIGEYKSLMEASDYLVRAYFRKKQFDDAYSLLNEMSKYRENLRKEEKIRQMDFLEFTYDFETQKIKLAEEEARSTRILILFISISLVSILISIILYLFFKNKKKIIEDKNIINQKDLLLVNQSEKINDLLTSRERMFTLLSSDLTSPIGNLKHTIDYLKKNCDIIDKDEANQSISIIHSATNKLYTSLENLIEWSKAQAGLIIYNPTKFDLLFIVNNTISFIYSQSIVKNIEIINKIQINTDVYDDLNLSSSIFKNLIQNAIENSDKNGKVIIYSGLNEKNDIIVSIQDYGNPIPRPILNKIFKKENVGDNILYDKNRSLGLILSKELIDIMGGKIWAESQSENGNTFSFTLKRNSIK